jgi:hypothetical protein
MVVLLQKENEGAEVKKRIDRFSLPRHHLIFGAPCRLSIVTKEDL